MLSKVPTAQHTENLCQKMSNKAGAQCKVWVRMPADFFCKGLKSDLRIKAREISRTDQLHLRWHESNTATKSNRSKSFSPLFSLIKEPQRSDTCLHCDPLLRIWSDEMAFSDINAIHLHIITMSLCTHDWLVYQTSLSLISLLSNHYRITSMSPSLFTHLY